LAFLGDYHTHTVHSHGKGTIEENVVMAIGRGLKEIAITDHGFEHMAYNVNRKDFGNIMQLHRLVVKKYPKIKVFLGLETNLQSMRGDLDIVQSDLENLDIVVAGYHKLVKPAKFRDFFGQLSVFFSNTTKISTHRQKTRNTDAFIKAIEKYPIDIISHPQAGIIIDILELCKAAQHYGTYIELNGKRIPTTDKEFEQVLQDTKVEFVANSDAHAVHKVGDFTLPLSVIERVGIPKERIANWDRLPNFRSRKNKTYYI